MRAFPFLYLLFVLFSCDSIEPKIEREVPEDLISKEQITEMLYEVQLIESAYKGRVHSDTTYVEKREARMLNMLEQNKVTQERFERSLAYYHQSPSDMGEIYEGVITKLNMKITQLEEKMD